MFELSLTNNTNSSFLISPFSRPAFNPALHGVVEFDTKEISIKGLRYLDERDDYHEDEKYVTCIAGNAFYSLQFSQEHNPLAAKDVMELYTTQGKKFLEELKGNFIILIYDKVTHSIFIAKDQLGLKYLYYSKEAKYFYVSTNLNDFKRKAYIYNYSAVLEKLVFTYPIGKESYLNNVFFLEQGCILYCIESNLSIEKYFNVEDLFTQENELESFEEKYFVELFQESVLQRAAVSAKLNVSLTGGFDGRANVSVLLRNNRSFRAYSFGKRGGENTKVPLAVSTKFNLDYFPVYLDAEYEKEYSKSAMAVIQLSDGISIFERANYIFALSQLAAYSNYNITGLIGGEIFSPVHGKSDYINEFYFDLIYRQGKEKLSESLLKNSISKYLNKEFIEQNELVEDLVDKISQRRNIVNAWEKQYPSWTYYLKDLITQGFQKFYGNQMHLERYYCENLTPFYDLDIIRYLLSTDHVEVYRNAFISNPYVRRNNRKLQSLIIKNSFPEIGEIPVDRGYPPNYNLDIRKLIIPYKHFRRKTKLKSAAPDFTSSTWCQILYEERIKDIETIEEEIFNTKAIKEKVSNYEPSGYSKNFNHLLSIALWMSTK